MGIPPKAGDRILILQPVWLDLILAGEKTLEIRGSSLRPGKYFLGCKKQILAVAHLGQGQSCAVHPRVPPLDAVLSGGSRPAFRPTDRLTDRLTDRSTDGSIDRPNDHSTD